MSGIVGIINTDGAPVDRQLLRRMTEFMTFRGPDAQDTWLDSHIGFGHTMLRTTFESEHEQQPCSLDGQVWITADARIDGRADLIQKLTGKGRHISLSTTDVELILHAYHVWGEACLDHLLGDFSFAIWDEREQQLFCARDHFGIKPFFYAQVKNHLLISNTLNCLRLHPAVSDKLNDHFIGDFLLTGFYVNPEISAFADIQRLPAAHCMKWKAGTLTIRRYWTLPINEPVYYKRSEEYVERFDELLTTAVSDRLRTNNAAVFMSGGMDSPTVAATAHKLLTRQNAPFDLQAYTVVYDRLIPDEERYYAGLVAKHLNIPINYLVADDYQPFERWDQPELQTPEPVCDPFIAASADLLDKTARQSRVVLTGEGGDAILRPSFSYLVYLLKKGRFYRLIADLRKYLWEHHQLPRIGFRGRFRRWRKKTDWITSYPAWLDDDFSARLNLFSRWKALEEEPLFKHPYRPEAYHFATAPYWSFQSDTYDPGSTTRAIEFRNPLLDVRLITFTMKLPSLPWCVDKKLMRVCMKNHLPEITLARQKTLLAGDPQPELSHFAKDSWINCSASAETLKEYIHYEKVLPALQEDKSDQFWVNLRPATLNHWLQKMQPATHFKEKFHEVTV